MPEVHERLVRLANAFRTELRTIQNAYNGRNLGSRSIDLVGARDEWIRDFFATMAIDSLEFLTTNLQAIREAHSNPTTDEEIARSAIVLEMLIRQNKDLKFVDKALMIDGLDS